jgi:UDP-N-acetylmuramate dehydrogenase
VTPQAHVALAPQCTLGVGGPARFFVEAADEGTVRDALAWARRRHLALRVLGGGSNLVVADEGVDGLVVKIALRGMTAREAGETVELTASAGEPWDDVVRRSVERGWAGLECLSGIPGLVGATPIQNVGAYGQEVSETVVAVRALDTAEDRIVVLDAAACGFDYRDSRFKSAAPGRWIVLAVTYRLRPTARPTVRYADVERDLAAHAVATPTLADVRESVLRVRRAKSMVLDAADPNRRSCGSFFVNPIVTAEVGMRAAARAAAPDMPRWPQADGRVKLSAAWLIERAGFRRGQREGSVGLSTRHTLAIVAHDGARAADVLGFARRVAEQVSERFGICLTLEPVVWPAAAPGAARHAAEAPAPSA